MFIGDYVERIQFDGAESTLNRVRHIPDGAGFLALGACANPFLNRLFKMGSHSEYDFDTKHFCISGLTEETAGQAIAKGLMARNQFVIQSFHEIDSPMFAESAFIEQFQAANQRIKPLILNFVSSIDGLGDEIPFEPLFTKQGGTFELLNIGYQPHCSRRENVELLHSKKVKSISLQSAENLGLLKSIETAASVTFTRPVWIRLDINSLKWSQSGSSRAWATGLDLTELIRTLHWLIRQTQIQGISIGPAADLIENSLAARTGAQILSGLIYAHANRRIVSSAHGKKDPRAPEMPTSF